MAFTKVIANACSSQKQPILHRFWPDGLASRVLAIEMWIAPVRSSPISTRAPRNVSRIAVTFEKRASMLPLSILFTDCFEIPARFASSPCGQLSSARPARTCDPYTSFGPVF
jgi:hypothetical protein